MLHRLFTALALALLAMTTASAQVREPYPELAPIATPEKTRGLLVPAWGEGKIPPGNAPDVVGAFRLICAPSHLSYDDPLLHPGEPGKAHLHQFFGNTEADAHSTFKSLRTTGDSTCGNILNRSAYWAPALIHGDQVVVPDYATVYYKRRPASDPACREGPRAQVAGGGSAENTCIGLPHGLRYIFGRTMAGGKYPAWRNDGVAFTCDARGSKTHEDMAAAIAACPRGARLGVQLGAPDCWDGRELDSPDHRAHMSFTVYKDGVAQCPVTHPWRIPTFHFIIWYQVGSGLDGAYFSSDRMPGMPAMPAGSTVHADWFGAWDDDTLKRWLAGCIDRFLNCSGGDLGDGMQIKGASQPSYGFTNPRGRVPIPAPGKTA